MEISYIDLTRRRFADQPPYQWHVSDDVIFTSPSKPLKDMKIALFSSGGVYQKGQKSFNSVKNDYTYRIIEKSANPNELFISHDNYDHSGAKKDINCVLPFERLQEFQDEGVIKEFSPRMFTFMGRMFSKKALLNELIPEFLNELQKDQVDAVLLVPV